MANHKSAEKRLRQSLKKRLRNRMVKSSVRSAVKKVKTALSTKEGDVKLLYIEAERAIAKAVSKGIYHKKNGSRQISRLSKFVKTTSLESEKVTA